MTAPEEMLDCFASSPKTYLQHISLPALIRGLPTALTSRKIMSSPSAKRRRIDAASHALTKPFRSPLKIPLTTYTADNQLAQKLPEPFDTVQPKDGDAGRILDPTKLRVQPTVTPSRMKAQSKTFLSPILSAKIDADPDIAALIKTQRQLEKELRELKEELDTAEQARRIEFDSQKKNPGGVVDGELSQLILKWRTASRQAAEELFTGVRDRVNRYAGMRHSNVHACCKHEYSD